MAISTAQNTLSWTVGIAVLTAAGLAVSVLPSHDSAASNRQSQNGGGVQVYGGGNVSLQVGGLAQQLFAGITPPSPAAYILLEAPHDLWVRSSGDLSGHHVGAVANNGVVWADCAATTSFDPDPSDNTGPQWPRIRWPNQQPTDQLYNSQPSDQYPARRSGARIDTTQLSVCVGVQGGRPR